MHTQVTILIPLSMVMTLGNRVIASKVYGHVMLQIQKLESIVNGSLYPTTRWSHVPSPHTYLSTVC